MRDFYLMSFRDLKKKNEIPLNFSFLNALFELKQSKLLSSYSNASLLFLVEIRHPIQNPLKKLDQNALGTHRYVPNSYLGFRSFEEKYESGLLHLATFGAVWGMCSKIFKKVYKKYQGS